MVDSIPEVAANVALRLLPIEGRKQYWHDARQVAAEAVLRTADKSSAYQFVAARNAVMGWVYGFLWGNRTHRVGDYCPVWVGGLDDRLASGDYRSIEEQMIAAEEEDTRLLLIEAAAPTIIEIMMAARSQKRGRAVYAAARDANIILMLLQGFSYEGMLWSWGFPPRVYADTPASPALI